jgi:hypothetical protein
MRFKRRTAVRFLAAAAVCQLLAGVSAAQDEASADAPPAVSPLEFPRTVESDLGTVVMHVPQIDSWDEYESIAARLAVEVTPAGESQPVYGVAEFTADTDPNLEIRVVAIENATITVTSFPESDDARREQLDAIVRATVQPQTQFVPLDVMLTYIAPDTTVEPTEGLSYDPPPIFYSSTPAVLVNIDGEPILAPIPDTRIEYAVNTNWDLFRYRENDWYLRHDKRWLRSDELSGEWQWDNRLPGDFDDLPDDGNWVDAKAAIPPEKTDEDEPTVFVSQQPAELIVTDGQAQHRTVGAAGLEYVDDTESDVFRYKFQYYYLVSGRWFTAGILRGPWEAVTELPEVFSSIPEDHEKSHVLAAVPHTDEARMAVMEATIPRKATIDRDAGENVSVFYEGEAIFEDVPGTDVKRAVNSPNDILLIGSTYYLCDSAVWYVSTTEDGPWVVADEIPAVIYSIPPSSPSYHVTHVEIEESDSETVSTSYDSGYFGSNVSFGVVVYGSGWYYPPYYGYYPGYPYYYPYPYSYGASSWYNPNTGMYGRSGSVYGPYGGMGRAASYNPETGAYARGRAMWDNDEIAGSAIGYNPRTGTGVATNRYRNEHGGYGESLITQNDKWLASRSQWDGDSSTTQFRTSEGTIGEIERQQQGDVTLGTGEFQRGDQSLDTKSVRGEQGTLIGYETGSGEQGVIGRNEDGDLYAGKDGNVYRRDEDGWSQHGENGWAPVDVPDDAAAQIEERRSANSENRTAAADRRSADSPSFDRMSNEQARATLNERGFANNSTSRQQAARHYDSNLNRGSFDSSRRNELDRSYNARSGGYQRYNSRQSFGGVGAGRSMPRRQR